jgi:predicted metal-binding membrane protein
MVAIGRDRTVVLGALTLICAIAWAYLAYMGWGMAHMDIGAAMAIMPQMIAWEPIDVALVFAMWSIMMVAMMLPSATPTILLFAALRRQAAHSRALADVAVFVAGYVSTWTVLSLFASLMQWGLLEARLVSPMMVAASPALGGGLLFAAGVFELTPFKEACLSKCRNPAAFIASHWRKGTRGAFTMGVRNGLYCVGCCWLLMLLLFVLGVMNLIWIALLSAFVLVEKILPNPRWFRTLAGCAFIGWGVALVM